MKPIRYLFSIPMMLSGLSLFAAKELPAYMDESLPMEQRVEDALSRMTTQEKINMIHAQGKFSSPGVPRLGIPDLWMSDGPHGVRAEINWNDWGYSGRTNDSITAFPALTALAAPGINADADGHLPLPARPHNSPHSFLPADVAGIEADLIRPGRDSLDSQAVVEVDVGDKGHVRLFAHGRHERDGLLIRYGGADNLASGRLEAESLIHPRVDIVRGGV